MANPQFNLSQVSISNDENSNRYKQNLPNPSSTNSTKKTETVETTTIETTVTQPTIITRSKRVEFNQNSKYTPKTVPNECIDVAVVENLAKRANSNQQINRNRHTSHKNDIEESKKPDTLTNLSLNEKVDGNKLVTTVGTIGVQTGQSRIVLALLKDGDRLQLKVQEMRPAFFEVGSNQNECQKYFEEHSKLIGNLKRIKQAPINEWMRKYELIRQKEPNMTPELRLVYVCMAENLQACWRSLIKQLELRLSLLTETNSFYKSADLLTESIDIANDHVQNFRQEFLNGPNSVNFNQANVELQRLNRSIESYYNEAQIKQQKLLNFIALIATENLGDARANYLISDGKNLINYISAYLDPLEKRKIQLLNVDKTTTITENKFNNVTNKSNNNKLGSGYNNQQKSNGNNKPLNIMREISSFNDFNLVESWLNLKVDQLNSSLLSSLGMNVPDSKSILNKHEQIALECSAIEEATLNFNGKNIHSIKSIDPEDDKFENNESLFEKKKELATKTKEVITILDARIILLKRTIDFYLRAKDATNDINIMMRRLQIENSLQSIQFVSNELELKDVSSVVASGATIISELQQLQLAQKHGQRSNIVNLNLLTNGIRANIDQLNQDFSYLKTILNQRKLILMNEDANKLANNYLNKCHQLQFWLNNHVKSYLITNNRIDYQLDQVRNYLDQHEKLFSAVQNKTLEVEALLRSLTTLIDNFDGKNKISDQLQKETDELRQDWIHVTNCLDRRIELAKKFQNLLMTDLSIDKNLNDKQKMNLSPSTQLNSEWSLDDTQANIEQNSMKLSNQVRNFNLDCQKINTELMYSPSIDARPISNDINKRDLVNYANNLLERPNNSSKRYDQKQEQQIDDYQGNYYETLTKTTTTTTSSLNPNQNRNIDRAPRFLKQLNDKEVKPFGMVELECELDDLDHDSKVEWLTGDCVPISTNVKHSISRNGNKHKLTIYHFSPNCSGTYLVRATNPSSGLESISTCRLSLAGMLQNPPGPSKWSASKSSGVASTSVSALVPKTNTDRRATTTSSITTTTNTHTTSNKDNPANDLTRIIRGVDSATLERPTDSASNVTNFRVSPAPSSGLASRSISNSPLVSLTPRPAGSRNGGLVCVVLGNPPPAVEWLHNNKTIASEKCPRPQSAQARDSPCKLIIQTTSPTDLEARSSLVSTLN